VESAPEPPLSVRSAAAPWGLGAAWGTLALHLAFAEGYGWFRDELYYVVASERLAWGYADFPPAVAAAAALARALFGEGVVAARVLSFAAGAAIVFLTAWMTREVGGGPPVASGARSARPRSAPPPLPPARRWAPDFWSQRLASKSPGHSSGSGAAGATGGARLGSSRRSRIAWVTLGACMVARSRMRWLQRGHSSTSTAKTRRRRSAQASRRGAEAGSSGAVRASSGPEGAPVASSPSWRNGSYRSAVACFPFPRSSVLLDRFEGGSRPRFPGGERAGS